MIRVVGLGPGDPAQLPAAILDAITSAPRLLLRTRIHPMADWLAAKGIDFETCDDLYQSSADFPSLYRAIANRVIETSSVFAVPGNPLFGEESVSLLTKETDVEILSAPGFVEVCLGAVRRSFSGSLQIWNAHEPVAMWQDSRSDQLIYNLDSKAAASETKLRLLRFFAPEHSVFLIFNGGTPQESVVRLPLSEMDHVDFHPLVSAFVDGIPLDRPSGFYGLVDVVDTLLGPNGCPWDKEQTHESLKKHLIEESYETIEAIDSADPEKLCEELGDLLLQPLMHSQMDAVEGLYDIDDVIAGISDKLIRRHPHVFGDTDVQSSAEVLNNWDQIKQKEKQIKSSVLGGVPSSLPALLRAFEISKRAARTGFEWQSIESVWAKVKEEQIELESAVASGERDRIESEFGDLLFTLVNIARWLEIEPEEALRKMVNRFQKRFEQMESATTIPLRELSADDWDNLWKSAKSTGE